MWRENYLIVSMYLLMLFALHFTKFSMKDGGRLGGSDDSAKVCRKAVATFEVAGAVGGGGGSGGGSAGGFLATLSAE